MFSGILHKPAEGCSFILRILVMLVTAVRLLIKIISTNILIGKKLSINLSNKVVYFNLVPCTYILFQRIQKICHAFLVFMLSFCNPEM